MSLVGFKAQNHPQQKTNPEVDDRATAPEVFGPLNERFKFTIDVAASAQNAKLERFYTVEDDGLTQKWYGERVWCNPPFSNIEPWVEHAWWNWGPSAAGLPQQGIAPAADLIVMLLPANRTEQRWWQEWVEPALRRRAPQFRVEFLPGRMRFIHRGQTEILPNQRPPFGCCLLVWERT